MVIVAACNLHSHLANVFVETNRLKNYDPSVRSTDGLVDALEEAFG